MVKRYTSPLARYCARPPVAMERLEVLADGRLLYRFKRVWRDGTTHIVLDPLEMLEKLAALIPAPMHIWFAIRHTSTCRKMESPDRACGIGRIRDCNRFLRC